MTNAYYNTTFNVTPGSSVGSQRLEDQFTLVQTGFDLVSTMLGVTLPASIALKATKAGDTYTGTHDFTGATPTAATKAAGDNTTAVATTAHVYAERSNTATLTNKTLTSPVINSPTGLTKSDVGLSNVDNTSDSAKPVSTATQNALDLKAPIASPAFTGTPTAPTPSGTSNDTTIATTAYVTSKALSAVIPVAAPDNGKFITNDGISARWGTAVSSVNGSAGAITGVATLTGTETLTNKTISGYTESVVAIGTVGSASTLSISSGTVLTATLTTATPCTFTMPPVSAGKSFMLLLKQPASGSATTATFTSVNWGVSGAPTITAAVGKMDILSFVSDGANWYGSASQGYTP